VAETLLAAALAAADADLAARYEHVDEWYVGEYTDHVYPSCPALRRTDPVPRRGQGRLYPEAGDVCGWCVRVWRVRKVKEETSSTTELQETRSSEMRPATAPLG
jgi:hypothetical protein